ncbi:MAG: ABC transporter permease [Gemmatimonadetes bacterium]|nr:ABC transporter permease [Gemmatimonadota bacterium]
MLLRLLGRVAAAAAVVLGVVLLTFLLLHLAPGDPAVHLAGPGASAAQLAAVRHTLGLDQPLPLQVLAWLGRAATGDWGTSLATGRPVATMLGEAWPWTAALVLLSLGLSYLFGIGLALLQAQGSARRDTILSVVSVALFAVPAYWLAVVLVWVFSWRLGWLPAFGGAGVDADFLPAGARAVDLLRHLALPLVTLTLIGVGGAARFVRGSLFDARREPFLVAARARGLSGRRLLLRHLLRNALGPVVTLLGLSLPALFSGTVFVEGVFAWPGVGRVLLLGVQARDYPVVMAAALVSAVLVVLGTLLADVLRAWLDPRVRHA